jgi:hypothetical protein
VPSIALPVSDGEGEAGQRTSMTLGAGLNRARASEADPPSSLTWETGPFAGDLDVLGNIGLRLDATASASVGTSSLNRVAAVSRLLLPLAAGEL